MFTLNVNFTVSLFYPSSQVSQQEEGEWETHPSVYCTALIWGEGEGRYWPLPLTDGPHALCVCP